MNRDQSIPVYDSAQHRSPIITELNELLNYRGLLRQYISQSIKTRYKRSALGVVWTLLNPLLNMAVLTIAFSTLFRFSLKNYPIYLLAGLIFWNFFSQTTMTAMDRLIWGGGILKRIYIPRTIFSYFGGWYGVGQSFFGHDSFSHYHVDNGTSFSIGFIIFTGIDFYNRPVHPGCGFVVFHLGFVFCGCERNVQNPSRSLVLSYSNNLSIGYHT